MNVWENVFDIPDKENRIKELEQLSARDDLWSDPEKARDILKKKTRLDAVVAQWRKLRASAEDLEILLGLAGRRLAQRHHPYGGGGRGSMRQGRNQ